MGINRWSEVEERKRNETDVKEGRVLPKAVSGDPITWLLAFDTPAAVEANSSVVEKVME